MVVNKNSRVNILGNQVTHLTAVQFTTTSTAQQ